MKNVLFVVTMFMTTCLNANGWDKELLNGKLSVIPELGMTSSKLSKTRTVANFGFNAGVGLRIGKREHLYTGLYYKSIRYPAFHQVCSDYLVVPLMFGLMPIKAPFF